MSSVLKLQDPLQSLGFNGQISSPLFADFRSDFSQSEHCRTTAMYPSNVAGDWNSGNKSGPEFRPEAPRSGSGPARPRLGKVRRGPSSQSSRSSDISRSGQVGPGFNPFRPDSENSSLGSSGSSEPFVFGAGRSGYSGPGSDKNVVLDELKGLRISGVTQKSESFSVSSSKLPEEEMKKLNIGVVGTEKLHEDLRKMNIRKEFGNEKGKSGNVSRDNVGGCSSVAKKDEIDSGLLNELTRKLSMKSGEDSSVAGEFGGTLRDQIGNLNIEDSSNTADDKAKPKSFAKDSLMGDFGSNLSHNLDDAKISGGVGESNSKVPKLDKDETKPDYKRTPSFEFKTAAAKPANLFSGVKEKVEFSATRDSIRDPRTRKKGGKLRGPTKVQLWLKQDFVARESSSSSQEIPAASDSYSPMEVSPYRETLAETRENSVKSDDTFSLDNDSVPPKVSSVAVDEDLAMATERMDINYDEGNETPHGETKEEHLDNDNTSTEGTESFKSADEEVDFIETEVSSSSSNVDTHDATPVESGANFCFSTSSSEDRSGLNFTFSTSTAAQNQSLNLKRLQKKKNVIKFGHESNVSSPTAKVSYVSPLLSGTSLLSSPGRGQKGDPPSLQRRTTDIYEAPKAQATNFGSGATSTASSIAAQEACEKWRLRGNQAYTSGDLSKAEDCYTRGISCVSKVETSRSCLRALMLCYSNRAATRISLGRMRDALEDCKMGAEIDPNFLRVQVRAANCYLSLGEVEDAALHFRRCLQAGSDICVDRKIAVEASDGLQKVQKLSECMNRSSELLLKKTSNDVESALGVIAEALKISPYSEKLLEMKAEALFLMRRYDDAIELCEQTLNSSENNSPLSLNTDVSKLPEHIYFRVWRCRISLKSHFQMGKLEEGLASLEKQEEKLSATHRNESKVIESSLPLTVTIRGLLRHKAAGNEAFQAGKHAEAVERYTTSLSFSVESRPFAAVCFCNRAAAFKALGQITDAIADCSLAMALDGNYLKAISRRATLYEMIRDYGQAARDLERLTDRIAKQLEEKVNQADRSHNSTTNDLRQARLRLSEIEEESRKDIPLDMYLILGIEPSVSTSEIKKAYRKAALRHHPDKAGQFLARSDNGDDGLWREIAEEVHKDADRLFKMIGEAYAVLSDPNKRARYDAEEEMRSALKKRNGNSSSRPQTEFQNYPFERSGRRQWQEVWRSYGGAGHSTATWSEASRSNRYT